MAVGAVSPAKFAADLRELSNGQYWTKELRRSYRRIGTKAAGYSRDAMRSGNLRGGGNRQVARAARATRGSATSLSARVSVGGQAVPGAVAAVWGHRGPTGWYGGWRNGAVDEQRRRGYARTAVFRPNNPFWIGNNWTVGVKGQGPRGINEALADHIDDLRGEVAVEVDRIAARAFPNRR